jgi:hypothetical protein
MDLLEFKLLAAALPPYSADMFLKR